MLLFRIGATCFGIETTYVKSVAKNLGWVNDKPVPDFADGLVSCGGRTIGVIDLKKQFSTKGEVREITEYTGRTDRLQEMECIIVSFGGNEFAIPIDETVDIFQVLEKDIASIPPYAEKGMSKKLFKGVSAVGNELVLVLDVSRFLN